MDGEIYMLVDMFRSSKKYIHLSTHMTFHAIRIDTFNNNNPVISISDTIKLEVKRSLFSHMDQIFEDDWIIILDTRLTLYKFLGTTGVKLQALNDSYFKKSFCLLE